MHAVDRPDLAEDPDLATNDGRWRPRVVDQHVDQCDGLLVRHPHRRADDRQCAETVCGRVEYRRRQPRRTVDALTDRDGVTVGGGLLDQPAKLIAVGHRALGQLGQILPQHLLGQCGKLREQHPSR